MWGTDLLELAQLIDTRPSRPGPVPLFLPTSAHSEEVWSFHSDDHERSTSSEKHLAWLVQTSGRIARVLDTKNERLHVDGLLTHYEKDLRQEELGFYLLFDDLALLAQIRFPLLMGFRAWSPSTTTEEEQEIFDMTRGGRMVVTMHPATVTASLHVSGPDRHPTEALWRSRAMRWSGVGVLDPDLLTEAIGLDPTEVTRPKPRDAHSKLTWENVRHWRISSDHHLQSPIIEDHVVWLINAMEPKNVHGF